MYVIWAVVGAMLCLLVEQSTFAAVVGVLLGLLWARLTALSQEVDALRNAQKRRMPRGAQAASAPDAGDAPVFEVSAEDDAPPPMPEPPTPAPALTRPAAPIEPRHAPLPPRPDPLVTLLGRVRDWFTEGNVPVKIGVLVLFAGVAALLKYAHDTGMLVVPIALRLAALALLALAGLAFGWQQRRQRRGFALSLQGGAIGVLVMVVFAALRLYGLLAPVPAFALLIVLVGAVGVLAVLQDALGLAVLGLVAGFAAPILVSTGAGSHVVLFGYYAVLNLAVFAVAWVKSWRLLNLLGFIATFAVATAWGVLRYRPEYFASTEPFLVLFFVLYLLIPWLYARRGSDAARPMDALLLFGNPLACLLLQGSLLDWQGTPLAVSAAVAAAVYALAAWRLRHQPALGVLHYGWAALAVGFATLAVPLAFSVSVTASVFALEGAGMVWLGLRQERRLLPWCGLGMQLLAAGSAAMAWIDAAGAVRMAVLNGPLLGFLLVVAAAVISAWVYQRRSAQAPGMALLAAVAGAWGLAWWLLAGLLESVRVLDGDPLLAALWLLPAVTAWLLSEATRAVPTDAPLGRTGAWLASALSALVVPVVLVCLIARSQPLVGWLLLATLISAGVGWRMLTGLAGHRGAAVTAHAGWWWRWAVLLGVALNVATDRVTDLATAWQVFALVLPSLLLWFAVLPPVLHKSDRLLGAPLPAAFAGTRGWLRLSLLLVLACVFAWALLAAGDATPMAFVPIFNPVDLLLIGIAGGATLWLSDADSATDARRTRPVILGILAVVLATDLTLRGLHHIAGVPWDFRIWHDSLAQLSLTVLWSLFGVLAWLWGSRQQQHAVWMAGAVAMAVVLLKLLLVDRAHLGNLFGIASFIAYGLLCVAIGYFAPRPPRNVTAGP